MRQFFRLHRPGERFHLMAGGVSNEKKLDKNEPLRGADEV